MSIYEKTLKSDFATNHQMFFITNVRKATTTKTTVDDKVIVKNTSEICLVFLFQRENTLLMIMIMMCILHKNE